MPGTMGTIAAAVIFFVCLLLFPNIGNPIFISILSLILFILGVWASNLALKLKIFGETKDPGKIVIDEFVGYYVAIINVPLSTPSIALQSMIIAFIWFRVFDILKPPPIKQFEKMKNGIGIMIDDVIAGIMALGTTNATLYFLS